MTPSLLGLKVTPSFCFPFKIPDDPTATNTHYLAQWTEIFSEGTFLFSRDILCTFKSNNNNGKY